MILKKEKLGELLAQLSKESTVYVPQILDGQSTFAPYQANIPVEFGGAKTEISPKEMLFPQTEVLYSYSKMGEDFTIEEVIESPKQVLFGVRSCDAYSIERLDEVFLTRDFVDTHYYARRSNTLIVALGCTKPDRACFCTSFGIDPAFGREADIQLTEIPASSGGGIDGYYVEAITEEGKTALKEWQPFLSEGEKPTTDRVEPTLSVDTEQIKQTLDAMFEDPYWSDLSMTCLNCGTCAFVCPTCHCFDMSQNNKGNTGYRFRTWDSCMFSEYTLMAGNHNPRPSKMKRLRNRFMHKLSFYNDRYGAPMCCGCGRCIEMCPVNIDISRIIEEVQEVKVND